MKTIIIAVIAVVVMVIGLQLSSKPVEFVRENTVEVIKNVEVTPEWATDEDAVKAAKAVIRKKELEVQIAGLDEEIKKLQAERKTAATELDSYWTRENVKALIKQTFPEDPHAAVAIAECESGLKPTAHNPTNKDGTTDGGLFQINSVHDKRLGELGLNKYDPEDAIKFARILYEESGWAPWVCAWKHLAIVSR